MKQKNRQHLKFIDLFSGIGGFRLGMERAGNIPVGWCEIDHNARKSYEAMYPHAKKEWNAKDINNVTNRDWRELNEQAHGIDVICGGFPCQSFSVAGERKGFLDKTRGTLFFQVARASAQIKPPYLFLENVKGLLNHNKGKTFRTILSTLNELGYDVEWHVLNSKAFGVPQSRERVYIIGHLRTDRRSTQEVFHPALESGKVAQRTEPGRKVPRGQKETSEQKIIGNLSRTGYGSHAIYDSTGVGPTVTATTYKHNINVGIHKHPHEKRMFSARKHGSYGSYDIYKVNGVSPSVRANKHIINVGIHKTKVHRMFNGRKNGYGSQDVYGTDGVSPTLNAMTGGDRQPKVAISKQHNRRKRHPKYQQLRLAIPCLTPDRLNTRQNGRRFKNNEDPEFTLDTIDRNGVLTLNNLNQFVIRKLTPLECWRLQGYPDQMFWTAKHAGVSNSQLYKQAGNSVSVPVVEWIARRLKIGKAVHDPWPKLEA